MNWGQGIADAISLGALYGLVAVGIGLVFGVMRLINFAYGELITAGAYVLAYTSGWPAPSRSRSRRNGAGRSGRESSSASPS